MMLTKMTALLLLLITIVNANAAIDIQPNSWVRVPAPATRPSDSGNADIRFVYDESKQEMVMFGGDYVCGVGYCRTTWTYNVPTNKWTLQNDDNPPTSFPSGRCQPGMAYDNDLEQVLMYGGTSSRAKGGYSWGNIWHYSSSNKTWVDYGGAGPAGKLNNGSAARRLIYDQKKKRAVAVMPASNNNLAVWEFDPLNPSAGWIIQNTTNTLYPNGEMYLPVIYDPKRGNYIVVALFNNDQDGNPSQYYPGVNKYETWVYNTATSTFVRSKSTAHPDPGSSYGHGYEMVYDKVNDVVLLYGGNCKNELWVYNIANDQWSMLTPGGDVPPGHNFFAMDYDSVENVMVVYGTGAYCNGGKHENPMPVYLYRYDGSAGIIPEQKGNGPQVPTWKSAPIQKVAK